MKLINFIAILGLVSLISFGCKASSPKSQENQASPTPQASSTPTLSQASPADPIPQASPTFPTLPASPTPASPQTSQISSLPQTNPIQTAPQTYQPPQIPQGNSAAPAPQTEPDAPVAQTNPASPTLQAKKPSSNPSTKPTETETNQGLKTLPDGDYFYGESPQTDGTGRKYLIFRKTGSLVTGQEYVFQTDHSNCFKGTAEANGITDAKIAYFQTALDTANAKWLFDRKDLIPVSELQPLSLEKVPEFATQNLQECINVLEN